jgi:NTE family protein
MLHRASFLGVLLILVGCGSGVDVTPVNVATSEPASQSTIIRDSGAADIAIGLAFSGGGTRAAAFAYGVLVELAATPANSHYRRRSLAEAVDLVTGVSGGSIAAAYFALKGIPGLADLRENFLLHDVEAELNTNINLPNLITAWRFGGVNDRQGMPRWLDANLFHGATFGTLESSNGPTLLINASDVYNRVPFVFSVETFNALCSSLKDYPLADAVAASAAVPIAFTPVILASHSEACDYQPTRALEQVLESSTPQLGLRATADAFKRYRDPSVMRYVKLLDGGIADNFGLQGLILSRAAAANAYRPLTEARAVKLRHFVFLVVDAGRSPRGDWALQILGPSGRELVGAAIDTAIDTNMRQSFDKLRLIMDNWRHELITWRCGLSSSEVLRLRGGAAGWNCSDISMDLGIVDFRGVGPEERRELDGVPTSLSLPAEQVDLVIDAGRVALRNNPAFKTLLRSSQAGERVSAGQ